MNLKISSKEFNRGKGVTILLDGDLDSNTSPTAEAQIETLANNKKSLVLDLSKLTYCSSAGLRIFTSSSKKYPNFALKSPQGTVMDVLKMTALDSILTIIE